jgi:hypothetical protein
MGSVVLGSLRRTLLGTAVTLAAGGFAGLAVTSNDSPVPRPSLVSPTYGTTGPFDSLPWTTSTSAARARRTTTTWFSGGFFETPRGMRPGTTTTTPPPEPETQVDAAVPAAGAQVSFGQGPGSCTEVAITALTPDECPPPDGEGPVIVDPGPTSDPIVGQPKNGFVAA